MAASGEGEQTPLQSPFIGVEQGVNEMIKAWKENYSEESDDEEEEEEDDDNNDETASTTFAILPQDVRKRITASKGMQVRSSTKPIDEHSVSVEGVDSKNGDNESGASIISEDVEMENSLPPLTMTPPPPPLQVSVKSTASTDAVATGDDDGDHNTDSDSDSDSSSSSSSSVESSKRGKKSKRVPTDEGRKKRKRALRVAIDYTKEGIFDPKPDPYEEIVDAPFHPNSQIDPIIADKLDRCVVCNYRTNAVCICSGCDRIYCSKCYPAFLKHCKASEGGYLRCVVETCPYASPPTGEEGEAQRSYKRVIPERHGKAGKNFLVTQRWVRENLESEKEYLQKCIDANRIISPVVFFAATETVVYTNKQQQKRRKNKRSRVSVESEELEQDVPKKVKETSADDVEEVEEVVEEGGEEEMVRERKKKRPKISKKGGKCMALWIQRCHLAPHGGMLLVVSAPISGMEPFKMETRLLFPNSSQDDYYSNPVYKNFSAFKKSKFTNPKNLSIFGKEGEDYTFISAAKCFSLKLVNQDLFTSSTN